MAKSFAEKTIENVSSTFKYKNIETEVTVFYYYPFFNIFFRFCSSSKASLKNLSL